MSVLVITLHPAVGLAFSPIWLTFFQGSQTIETESFLDGVARQKRAVLYARTSGSDKAVDSLPSQIAVCEKFSHKQGYTIIERLSEDARGVSGGDKNAPALNKALQMAQAGLYDVLIIRDVKRYSRDVYKAMDFEGRFFDAGIAIEYVWNPELNGLPRRGTGFVMRFFQYWLAEEDRQHIVKKLYFKRVEVVESKNRVLVHGKPPYGYDELVIRDGSKVTDRRLVVNEAEAYWVKTIFTWYVVDGLSLQQICANLRENKVLKPSISKKSKQHITVHKSGVYEWSHITVRDILIRRAYMGEFEYRKKSRRKTNNQANSIIADDIIARSIIVKVPAIVGKELWTAAQEKMAQNKSHKRGESPHIFLVRHRGRCQACGGAMIAKAHKVNGKYYFQYRCAHASHKTPGHERCTVGQFNRDRVDGKIWQWLTNLMNDDDELRKGFEDYQNDTTSKAAPLEAELSRIEESFAEYQRRLAAKAQAIELLASAGSKDAVELIQADVLQIEKMLGIYRSEKARVEGELKAVGQTVKIEEFSEFVRQIKGRIERANGKPEAQVKVIKALNVTCDFMLVNGKKAFRPKCVVRNSEQDVFAYDVSTSKYVLECQW